MNLATAAAEKEVQMNGERLEGGDRHSEGKISQGGAHFGVNEDSTNVQDAKQIPIPAEAKTVSSDGGTISLLTSHKEIEDIESIPKFVHEHSATLSFPEKLFLMLTQVERECAKSGADVDEACICWILEGRAFAIRNKQVLVDTILPLIFRKAKFPSFTRKLYRWGFRQVSITEERVGQRQELIFGHENFQRNNRQLMAKMKSVTAAGTRRAIAALAVKQQSAANRMSVMANSGNSNEALSLPANSAIKNISDFSASTLQQPSLTLISQDTVNRLGALGNPMLQNAVAAAVAAAQQQQQQSLGSSLFNNQVAFSNQVQPSISQQYLANLSALALRTLQPEAAEAPPANGTEAGAPSSDRLHAAVDLLLRFASP